MYPPSPPRSPRFLSFLLLLLLPSSLSLSPPISLLSFLLNVSTRSCKTRRHSRTRCCTPTHESSTPTVYFLLRSVLPFSVSSPPPLTFPMDPAAAAPRFHAFPSSCSSSCFEERRPRLIFSPPSLPPPPRSSYRSG